MDTNVSNIEVGDAAGTGFFKFATQQTTAPSDADLRALYVKSDVLNFWDGTGEVSISAGSPVAITVTEPGAAIPATATHVTVTSANADHILTLPAPALGKRIIIVNGATGYELRSSSPTTIGINGGTGADAESAIAANMVLELICATATNWIGNSYTAAGVKGVVQVAA